MPSVGWGVLHLFCRPSAAFDGEAVVAAVKRAQAAGDQVVTVSLLGHKADIGFMVLAEDLWRLRRLQSDLVASGFQIAGSYVSLTEVSDARPGFGRAQGGSPASPAPPEGQAGLVLLSHVQAAGCSGRGRARQLVPSPVRRAQGPHVRPRGERAPLRGPGVAGRHRLHRAGRLRVGVTLFANTPDDLKEVVYTMRFDEASAIYADFGPFWTGMVASVEDAIVAI